MPSLARVMPAISFVIGVFLPFTLVTGLAVLGIAVDRIREHLFDDLGLEFSIRPLRDLGQVKILDRIAVGIELEAAAQRGEIRLLQRRRYCLTRFTPRPPGMKVNSASGFSELILVSSGWKSIELSGR